MLDLPRYLIYPLYTVALSLVLLAVVPKKSLGPLAKYGIVFGAVMNIILMSAFGNILGWGSHINYGPLGQAGLSFFPPIAWTVYYMMYIYILPKERYWIYLLTLIASGYSVFFANVLVNLEIFETNVGRLVVPYIFYLSWHSLVSWYYINYIDRAEFDNI